MFLPKSKYGVDCQAKCEPLISTNADCSVGFVDVGNVCVCHKGSYKKESDKQTCNQSKTGISEFGTWSNEKYFNCDPVTCDVEVSKMQTIKIGNSTCSEKETQFGDACNLSCKVGYELNEVLKDDEGLIQCTQNGTNGVNSGESF